MRPISGDSDLLQLGQSGQAVICSTGKLICMARRPDRRVGGALAVLEVGREPEVTVTRAGDPGYRCLRQLGRVNTGAREVDGDAQYPLTTSSRAASGGWLK